MVLNKKSIDLDNHPKNDRSNRKATTQLTIDPKTKDNKDETTMMLNDKTDITIADFKRNGGTHNTSSILEPLNNSKHFRLSRIQEERQDTLERYITE
jgi:hypothetical protein